ncbi:Peroxisomal membrane signal receptor PTS1, partial [Borealophlyctis nickersoniae]
MKHVGGERNGPEQDLYRSGPEFEHDGLGSSRVRQGRLAQFDDKLADEFFEHPHHQRDGRDVFAFGEMEGQLEKVLQRHGPVATAGRAAEGADAWAAEFDTFEHRPLPMRNDEAFEHAFQMARLAKGVPQDWREEFMAYQDNVEDFTLEAAFRRYQQEPLESANYDEDWSREFEAVRQSIMGGQDIKGKGKALSPEETSRAWIQSFESVQNEATTLGGTEAGMEELERIYREINSGKFDPETDADFSVDTSTWEDDFASFRETVDPDPVTAPLVPYTFEENNPYISHPDPFAEGRMLMNQGGSLSAAALAFEAAVQRDPENTDAWAYLGIVQAENEKEGPAIAALQRSTQEDPKNLMALMALAVSYTNEGQDLQAYATLERWLSTRYPTIAPTEPQTPASLLTAEALHARVTSLFLEAARAGPSMAGPNPQTITNPAGTPNDDVDADVQVGLGVLFYNSSEFAKAVDCFTAALAVRPSDYLLWNRLGATLANSGRSEEAIDAYYKALEIKPTFVRGRYNLGVSCINIGCYREAAEHLLGAL